MERRLVIGLDFGTVYSSVAYADDFGPSRGTRHISLITDWPSPGHAFANYEKVPSRIAYCPQPDAEVLWGYLITPNTKATVHTLMKPKLEEQKHSKHSQLQKFLRWNFDVDDDLNEEDDSPDYPRKKPVDMVADYLALLWQHTFGGLAKGYGENLLHTMRKELVVTLPTAWSQRAASLLLEEVRKANFDVGRISTITEPEAAAIYSLETMRECASEYNIKAGDILTVCDARSTTVDLISYKVTQVTPTLQIEEATVGSRARYCGDDCIDKVEEFLEWLRNWVGSNAYKRIRPAETSRLINSFQSHKFYFTGTEDDMDILLPRSLGIDDDESLNIEDSFLFLKTTQMQQIFDPCVNRVLEVIDDEVKLATEAGQEKPKILFLVGTFGRNEYLRGMIENHCLTRGIQFGRPHFPSTAVVRGAVCHGLNRDKTYPQLDKTRNEIGLVTFTTDSTSYRLTCTMTTRELSNYGPFTALSYPWGGRTETDGVILNGGRTRITKNAVLLLRDMERRRARFVWIDSLCIDEDNEEEKSQQVQLMARIYGPAEQVDARVPWAWKGSDTEKVSNPTFTFIKQWAGYHDYLEVDWKIRELKDDSRLWEVNIAKTLSSIP